MMYTRNAFCDSALRYEDQLNMEYGIPGVIHFSTDEAGLPRVWIRHPYR